MKRRAFVRMAGAALAATSIVAPGGATAIESRKMPWKKAFMLGGVSKGSPKPAFQLLKEAGFDGVELISPNDLDRARY